MKIFFIKGSAWKRFASLQSIYIYFTVSSTTRLEVTVDNLFVLTFVPLEYLVSYTLSHRIADIGFKEHKVQLSF